MATKKELRYWISALKKSQRGVAKERDQLTVYVDEMESLKEDCDNAWHDLQSAIDSLSEIV